MKVCIDPGHGGSDPGAIGYEPFELRESSVALSVALALRTELSARGMRTLMTRRRDQYIGLRRRARIANDSDADLFVSIHCNAAHNNSAQGMEVWHYPSSPKGKIYALSVLRKMLDRLPQHMDRGIKESGNFTVLRETQMPAILVELEFITNSQQLEFLSSPSNQYTLAECIAFGIALADTG